MRTSGLSDLIRIAPLLLTDRPPKIGSSSALELRQVDQRRYGIKFNSVAMPNNARKLTKAMTLGPPLSVARHVLVVDDDAAVRKSIKFVLELEGFEVLDFSSAEELLVEQDLPPHSCLVVDYYMPGMNGLELVARLRDRDSALPAVLITSFNNKLRNQAAASGVIMVEKPMLAGPLLNAVRAAFDGETPST